MAQKLRVTRNQLASFLTDPELIRQFELLFASVNDVVEVDVDGLTADATLALAKANLAVALASKLQGAPEEASAALSAAQGAARALAKLEDVARLGAVVPPLVPKRRNVFAAHDMARQTIGVVNVEQPVVFNAVDLSRGAWGDGATGKMFVADAGIYNVEFSLQLDRNKGTDSEFWVWLRIDGVDVPESASVVRVKGNNAETVAAWNFLVELPANVPVQLMWTTDDVDTYLETFAAAGVVPAIPSAILTITQEA